MSWGGFSFSALEQFANDVSNGFSLDSLQAQQDQEEKALGGSAVATPDATTASK